MTRKEVKENIIISEVTIHSCPVCESNNLRKDGDTPALRAGIDIKGNNKWLTIIQNASKN